jgi:hypothetical protein
MNKKIVCFALGPWFTASGRIATKALAKLDTAAQHSTTITIQSGTGDGEQQ